MLILKIFSFTQLNPYVFSQVEFLTLSQEKPQYHHLFFYLKTTFTLRSTNLMPRYCLNRALNILHIHFATIVLKEVIIVISLHKIFEILNQFIENWGMPIRFD